MKLKAIVLFALLSASLSACASPAAEDKGPEAAVDRFVQAWNSHDGNKIASVFTEDGYVVYAVDLRTQGRANIATEMGQAHANWAKTTTMKASDIAVRPLGPDAAAILFRTEFVGQQQPRAVLLAVVKASGEWRIAALQLTKPDSPHPSIRLKALQDMLDKKSITPEEYERKRKALIDGI